MSPDRSGEGFRYQLSTADGDLFGEAEYAYQPSAGDVYVNGHRRSARILRRER